MKSNRPTINITHPELLKEWNFEKNSLKPTEVTSGSNKKAWWKCQKCESEWMAGVYSRAVNKTGCPYCIGQKANHTNSLASLRPDIAKDWDYNKNTLTPNEVTLYSNKKVFWKCTECSHEWRISVTRRSNGNVCSKCNSLASTHPELAAQWHEKNKIKPTEITSGSDKKVWWECHKGHSWFARIADRKKGKGCPQCSGRNSIVGETDMWTTNSKLASWLLNPEEGYFLKERSNVKTDWKCPNCSTIIKSKSPNGIMQNGNLPCPQCSDGFSFGEKLIYRLLSYGGIEFSPQKVFSWSDRKMYDFYLSNENAIIEVHGIQHYEETGRGRSLQEEQENDRMKLNFAIKNGIEKYIVLNFSSVDYDHIRAELQKHPIFSFVTDEAFEECMSLAHNSFVTEACQLYASGFDIHEICEKLKIDIQSIRKYLKTGHKLGLCPEYNGRKCREIVMLVNDVPTVYNSVFEAAEAEGIGVSTIYRKTYNGEPDSHNRFWVFKEQYDKQNN